MAAQCSGACVITGRHCLFLDLDGLRGSLCLVLDSHERSVVWDEART